MKKRVSTIQELYDFLQVHLMTRTELDKKFKETNERFEKIDERLDKTVTKKDFEKFKNDALARIDRFIVLHEKLETELTALKSQYNRLETRLEKLEAQLA